MTIEVEQVKKLIDDYWVYERECRESSGEIAYTRAALYRTVIMDLEKLLPRKSMADVDPETWPEFVGTWVENEGVKRIITDVNTEFAEKPIGLFDPRKRATYVAAPNHVFPLDEYPPVWDEEGNPI